jgi:hypothetical protein
MIRLEWKTVAQNGKRKQNRNRHFHHEGREEHEVKKFKNINFSILRVLHALRGEIWFS